MSSPCTLLSQLCFSFCFIISLSSLHKAAQILVALFPKLHCNNKTKLFCLPYTQIHAYDVNNDILHQWPKRILMNFLSRNYQEYTDNHHIRQDSKAESRGEKKLFSAHKEKVKMIQATFISFFKNNPALTLIYNILLPIALLQY
jgi:RAB protein geranylgeranyltransferase component A